MILSLMILSDAAPGDKPRRSDMFIAREPQNNRLQPHRGGMGPWGGSCRPYGAGGPCLVCVVAINMALLRSLSSVAFWRASWPEPAIGSRPDRVSPGGLTWLLGPTGLSQNDRRESQPIARGAHRRQRRQRSAGAFLVAFVVFCDEPGRGSCLRSGRTESRTRNLGPGELHVRRYSIFMSISFLKLTGVVLVAAALAGCHSPPPQGRDPWPDASKIKFQLEGIRPDGLRGPPDGLVSVAYEFCVPADEGVYQAVRRIDPSVQISPGSPGRIGCSKAQALCTGSTHQPRWRDVIKELSSLPYVAEIRQCFFE
jgi:hypothetical protein